MFSHIARLAEDTTAVISPIYAGARSTCIILISPMTIYWSKTLLRPCRSRWPDHQYVGTTSTSGSFMDWDDTVERWWHYDVRFTSTARWRQQGFDGVT